MRSKFYINMQINFVQLCEITDFNKMYNKTTNNVCGTPNIITDRFFFIYKDASCKFITKLFFRYSNNNNAFPVFDRYSVTIQTTVSVLYNNSYCIKLKKYNILRKIALKNQQVIINIIITFNNLNRLGDTMLLMLF